MPLTILRVSAATALLVAVGVAMAPHATTNISTSAVVNAPLVSVYAPFDGMIETASNGVATAVNQGDRIVELKDARSQGAQLRSLKSELAAVSGEISGLEMQRRNLAGLREDLLARRDAQIEARMKWYQPRLDEARAEVDRAEAQVVRAEDMAARLEQLAERGNAPQRDLIEARADVAEAKAEKARQDAALQRLIVERDYLGDGAAIDLAADGMEHVDYRLDEIMVRDADLDSRLLTLQTRRAALKGEISGLELEQLRNTSFAPKAAVDGVVWEASGREGATVATGEQVAQILNCKTRFLEVILGERHFENIAPGDEVSVKLKGAKDWFTAKVAAVYGSGARPNRNMQAARPRIDAPDGLRVIVVIGKADVQDPKVARSFCDVGRTAEVRFPMKSNPILTAARKGIETLAGYVPVAESPVENDEDGRTVAN